MSMRERTKLDAIRNARDRTEREGRKYVVREDHGRFFVCPLYEEGREEGVSRKHDAGYAAMGVLVEESL